MIDIVAYRITALLLRRSDGLRGAAGTNKPEGKKENAEDISAGGDVHAPIKPSIKKLILKIRLFFFPST